jgi:hypothetical protein
MLRCRRGTHYPESLSFQQIAIRVKGAEILTTIAQLAVAVTGFSGIAIAFNRHPGRLSDVEAFRVLILFANSLAAIFLSLIPFAFFYLDWSESTVWRMASASCVLFEIGFMRLLTVPTRRFLRENRELFSVPQLMFIVCGHVLNTLLQLANALGFTGARNLPIFIFALLWLLFHSIFQFGRILFVQPVTGGAMSSAPGAGKDRHHSP